MICLMAGRRWGKTFGVVRNRIIKGCLGKPRFSYLYCAPSYALCKQEFEALNFHPGLSGYIARSNTQPFPRIVFANGSAVSFRSLDRPDLLRGGKDNEIWIDEVQGVDESDITSVVRARVADTRGTIGISGQFRGTEHWIYQRWFAPGQNPGQMNIRSWRFPTSSGVMFQDAKGRAELDLIKATTPHIEWLTEYECEPTASKAAIFPFEDIQGAKRGGNSAPTSSQYIIGLDLGRVRDPSALVVIDTPRNCVVHSESRPLGEHHEIGAKYVAGLAARYNSALVLADTTGGATGGKTDVDEYVKYYRQHIRDMRPMVLGYNQKKAIIDTLALGLQQRQLGIPEANLELFRQLSTYEYSYTGNQIHYHGPGGHDDDMVIALAMAWWGTVKGWNTYQGGRPLGTML